MPVVWPTLLDLSRDECKRILRKLGMIFIFDVYAFLDNVSLSVWVMAVCIISYFMLH